MVAVRKYQCHNVGTLLPTLGSIGLGEVGEVVTGPERSGHGQQPHCRTGQRPRNVPDKIVAPVAAFWCRIRSSSGAHTARYLQYLGSTSAGR